MKGRNNIPLYTRINGELVSHFTLREFETDTGVVMLDLRTLKSLELLRRDLNELFTEEVWVIITSALRTVEKQEELATRLGWTDEGGAVSRDSQHLPCHGGVAVDLVAVSSKSRGRVPQELVGQLARNHFVFVKDDYPDGHVHADNREVL